MLVSQIKLNHQDCLLSIILGIGIDKERVFQSAASYSPFEPSIPVSYAPCPTSAHPYLSWGWSDSWAHTPSYFRPYHVEYAAPRRPSRARQPYVESDRFEYKNRSSAQNKKKVVKQVYKVKEMVARIKVQI
jgi:hypothetical protein